MPKSKFILEKQFQSTVTNWLKEKNIPYYKVTGGIMRGSNGKNYIMKSGFPDLMIFQAGNITLIELKTDKKSSKLRDSQVKKFEELHKESIQVYVMRPHNWKAFKDEYVLHENIHYCCLMVLKTWKKDLEEYGKQTK